MITIETEPYKRRGSIERKAPPPPFCPNPECPHHDQNSGAGASGIKWFVFHGSRENARHGLVWFYLCRCCERSFSSSSFLISYYEKVSLSYDVICSYARHDISLAEWARLVKTSPGTLKLRLCKLGRVLLKELSKLCVPAAGELLMRLHAVVQKGGGAYAVLRELIVQGKALLNMLRPNPENLPIERLFLSSFKNEKKNLFFVLITMSCRWRYRITRDFFFHTKYQLE